MIRFALICDNGHEFESWFASNESFDFQDAHHLIACPHCNCEKVSKAVMAPAVARKDRDAAARPAAAPAEPARAPATQAVALLGEGDRELRDLARALHAKLVAATVDVGDEFPNEARKIHDGEAPERPIRGQASLEDARALLDEGVSILPMPILPEDHS